MVGNGENQQVIHILKYFKVELQKPRRAGAARETVGFICVTQPRWVWHPWTLDGGAGTMKPVLQPYVQNATFFFQANHTSRT